MTGAFALLWCVGAIGAQDAPPPALPTEPVPSTAERPLAIPYNPSSSPGGPTRSDTTAVKPASSLRTYRAEALRLASGLSFTADTTVYNSPGMGWWGPSVGTSQMVSSRMGPQLWRGNQLLDNLDYLDAVGRVTDLRLLEQRVRRYARTSRIGNAVGMGGALTTLVGFVAAGQARTNVALRDANWVIGAGVVSLVTGAVIGGSAGRRFDRAQFDLDELGDLDQLQSEVDAHNQDLRVRLGLTDTQALDVDYPSP